MPEFLSSSLASGLTLTLLHFLWQGLLVAVAYWALLAMAGSLSARARYAMSLVALGLMAVAPLVTFVVVYDSADLANDSTVPGAATLLTAELEPEDRAHDSRLPVPGSREGNAIQAAPAEVADDPIVVSIEPALAAAQPIVLFVWLAGVLLSGTRLIAGFANVVWLRWGRAEVSPELVQRSHQIAERLQLASARVFASVRIGEAAVVGFLRPVVLLPASWLTTLPPDVLEAVIAHELAHIRRYDVWANLLQRIVETLLFYHPAVWWLSNRIRVEREMCCDELAAEITGDRGEYALALEQVGRLQAEATMQLSPAFLGDRKMNMLKRVKHVLGMSVTEREPAWLVGIIALAIPALLVGMSGVHPGLNVAAAQDVASSPVVGLEPTTPTVSDAIPTRTDDTARESGTKIPAAASEPIEKILPAAAEGSGGRYQIQTTTVGVVLLDTKTGESWSLSERDGARVWLPIPPTNQQPTRDETANKEPTVTDGVGTIEYRGATPIRLTLGQRFDSAVIEKISELTTLEEIDARHCVHMKDADLAHFAGLTNLRKLKLPAGIGDEGVRHLSGLTELVQLLFQDARITGAGMEHLKSLNKLEELGFWRCVLLTDDGFDHLERMTSLKSLDLRRCAKLTDETLQQISHLHSLEVLDVGNVPGITDVGLKSIGAMANLKYLGTVNTAITDFTTVRRFENLELINVPPTFGDDQIQHLKGLPKLTNIGLDGSRVTDEGMAIIGSMQQVRWLAIRDTSVTDAGLVSLEELPLLSYLHLEGTQTTDDQISDLQKRVPHCVVTGPRRQNPLLGF